MPRDPRDNPFTPAAHALLSDEQGQPRVLYHGTRTRFQQFGEASESSLYGPGYYFTESRAEGLHYARDPRRMDRQRISGNQPHVLKRHLGITNPLDITEKPSEQFFQSAIQQVRSQGVHVKEWRLDEYRSSVDKLYGLLTEAHGDDKAAVNAWIRKQGYDAIRYRIGFQGESVTHWVAFSPDQVHIPSPRVASIPSLQKDGLQQIHTNLESKTGQFLKRLMQLPFKKKSTFDWTKGVEWAERTYARMVQGWKAGRFSDFNFQRRGGALHYTGLDEEGSFKDARAMTGFDVEVFAHGGAGPQDQWLLWNMKDEQVTVDRFLKRAAQEQNARTVMLHACNPEGGIVRAPKGTRVIYGIGSSTPSFPGEWQTGRERLRGATMFNLGVAVAEGDETRIYTKPALQAMLTREGKSLQNITRIGPQQQSRIGLVRFADKPGLHVTADTFADSVEELEALSKPLESLPAIIARRNRFGNKSLFTLPTGERFRDLGSAVNRLTEHVKAGVDFSNPSVQKAGVNQLHVNLESKVGQFLKQVMRLPFKSHSRVDPAAAAQFARAIYQKGMLTLGIGATLISSTQSMQQALGAWVQAPKARMVTAYDWNRAFDQVRPSGLADVEIALHGGGQKPWTLQTGQYEHTPAAAMINELAHEQSAKSVLIRSCNARENLVPFPKEMKVTHGLGLGYTVRKGVTPESSVMWTHGVVMTEGKHSKIYTASSLESLSHKLHGQTWSEPGPLVMAKPSAVRSGYSGIGIYKAESGETMLGRYNIEPVKGGARFQLAESIPLEKAPFIEAEVVSPGKYQFKVGQWTGNDLHQAKRQLALQQQKLTPQELAKSTLIPGAHQGPGMRVAREVHPHPKNNQAVTRTIFKRRTLFENHVNLESKAGQLIKRLFNLPFKRHSQVDPMKAATQAAEGVVPTVEQNARRFAFTPMKAGILLGGTAVVFGSLFLAKKSLDGGEPRGSHDGSVSRSIDRGRQEGSSTEYSTRTNSAAEPRGTTHIQVSDAPLNMREVEDALTHHMTRGYAH